MTEKHTPTPWRIGSTPLSIRGGENGIVVADVKGHNTRLRGKERIEEIEYCQGNAEFIVRAVNSHYSLIAALKEALSVIDDYLDYEHNGDPWTEDARAMGEMDINDYGCDGRMENARATLTEAEKS